MSNLRSRDQYDRETQQTPSNDFYSNANSGSQPGDRHYSQPGRQTSSIKPFLWGVLSMAVLGLIGGGIYLLNQRSQTTPQTAVSPASSTVEAPKTQMNSAPTSAQPSAAPAGGDASLPAPQTLNLQVNHPNGSTLRLTQLSFSEDSITASLAATNGYRSAIRLNSSHDMVLIDNLGNQYNLAEPPANEYISIDPGTTLKGDFVFKGRIAPGATSVTLTTNNQYGGDKNYSNNPKLSFANIPVQGATAP